MERARRLVGRLLETAVCVDWVGVLEVWRVACTKVRPGDDGHGGSRRLLRVRLVGGVVESVASCGV